MTDDVSNAVRRRPLPGAKAVATLLALAAICHPLAARVLGEMDARASFVLPTVICVVALCMLVPRQFMPELTVAVTYLAEWAFVCVHDRPFGQSPLRRMLAGDASALAVPVGAAVLGHMIAWVLRNRPLWRWGGKTNLRLLLRNMGIKDVVVVGIFTDQCISSSVRSLVDESFGVVVVEDCCAAATMELHHHELEIINMIYCHVVRLDEVLGFFTT